MSGTKVFFASAGASLMLIPWAIGGGLPAGHVGRAAAIIRADRGPSLLLFPAVQEELKLSTEQIAKINDMANELRAAAAALDKQDAAKKIPEINVQGAKAAADLLKPEQFRRIQQIQVQVVGPSGFLDPEVAEKIKLTLQQRQSIREAYNEGRLEVMKASLKLKLGSKIIEEFNAATMGKIMTILSEEQKREYSKMAGEPFHGTLPFISGPVLRPEPKKE